MRSLVDQTFEAEEYLRVEGMLWLQLADFVGRFIYRPFVLLFCIYSQHDWVHKAVDNFEVSQMVSKHLVDFWKDLMH